MRNLRSGRSSATTAVVLGFAVLLMHLGMPPAAATAASVGPSATSHGMHRATPADAAFSPAEHGTSVDKQSLDAVHDHESHDCAGTVVVHKQVAPPALVAVLPLPDGAPDVTPATRAALARGPPPWTVHDLAQLCVLRV
ncbi:hypothetical protein [Tsukamurella pulmonis]|uniref:hypothetical protein n=1 Tax=Tsukamurella pulmonis TaxID=47312 RepID=UPI0009F1CA8F|nr:hypothetical protein [Tsukamurella pulmonis]